MFETIETYVCNLYGADLTKKKIKRKVNVIRFSQFNRQYNIRDVNES